MSRRSKRILVEMAEGELLSSLRQHLKRGSEVVAVNGHGEMLEAFRRERPDLIILQLTEDTAGGLSLCSRLRAECRGQLMPLIVIAPAQGHAVALDQAIDAGADSLFPWPVDLERLARKVSSYLEMSDGAFEEREMAPEESLFLSAAAEAEGDDLGVEEGYGSFWSQLDQVAPLAEEMAVTRPSSGGSGDRPLAGETDSPPWMALMRSLDLKAEPQGEAVAPLSEGLEELPREGSLEGLAIADLLGLIFQTRMTGRLSLTQPERSKTLWFDDGIPIYGESTDPADRMVDLLFRLGKLTRRQLQESRRMEAQAGQRLVAMLVELGFIKPREGEALVQRHMEEVIYGLFEWEAGSFHFEPLAVEGRERVPLALHPGALVLEGIRRKVPLFRLKALVGPPLTLLLPALSPAVSLANLRLSEAERRVACLVDVNRTVSQVIEESGAEEAVCYRVIYGLRSVGLIRSRRALGGIQRAEPEDLEAQEEDLALDLERLLDKAEQVENGTYFEFLGVGNQASDYEIYQAYHELSQAFDPNRFIHPLFREHLDKLQEIWVVIQEAYEILGLRERRNRYLQHLSEGGEQP